MKFVILTLIVGFFSFAAAEAPKINASEPWNVDGDSEDPRMDPRMRHKPATEKFTFDLRPPAKEVFMFRAENSTANNESLPATPFKLM